MCIRDRFGSLGPVHPQEGEPVRVLRLCRADQSADRGVCQTAPGDDHGPTGGRPLLGQHRPQHGQGVLRGQCRRVRDALDVRAARLGDGQEDRITSAFIVDPGKFQRGPRHAEQRVVQCGGRPVRLLS